jgi:hypothetical protein
VGYFQFIHISKPLARSKPVEKKKPHSLSIQGNTAIKESASSHLNRNPAQATVSLSKAITDIALIILQVRKAGRLANGRIKPANIYSLFPIPPDNQNPNIILPVKPQCAATGPDCYFLV